ncbi:unnamed protein product [Sympodiomycopsis kandeliae]
MKSKKSPPPPLPLGATQDDCSATTFTKKKRNSFVKGLKRSTSSVHLDKDAASEDHSSNLPSPSLSVKGSGALSLPSTPLRRHSHSHAAAASADDNGHDAASQRQMNFPATSTSHHAQARARHNNGLYDDKDDDDHSIEAEALTPRGTFSNSQKRYTDLYQERVLTPGATPRSRLKVQTSNKFISTSPALPSPTCQYATTPKLKMPPKSAKSKARAEARKDKADSKKAAATQPDQESVTESADDTNGNSSTTKSEAGDLDDDEEEGSDADGFEDAQGGEEQEARKSVHDTETAEEQTKEDEEPQVEAGHSTSEQVEEKEQDLAPAKEEPTSASTGVKSLADEVGESETPQEVHVQSPTADDPIAKTIESEPIPSSEPKGEEAAPSNVTIPTESAGNQSQPPPPPPRKQSQSSLWDRLKTPAERAAAGGSITDSSASSTHTTAETSSSKRSSTAPLPGPPLPRRPSQAASSFLNSLTSAANYAATSAASRGFQLPERLGGGAAAAASLSPSTVERKRLPHLEVDEAKMMEDQMRFAEARHLLATSKDLQVIRKLGQELEQGWREKLAELTESYVKMEDLTSSVSDIEDENIHLRQQIASLSEQIAYREEDFESFQRLTVAHQEREKELWKEEGREEKEQLEWKEREAVRVLAEERAINAQLRIVLLRALKDGEEGLRNGSSSNGAFGKGSRLSLVPGSSDSSDYGDPKRRTMAVFDESSERLRESERDEQSDSGVNHRDSQISQSNGQEHSMQREEDVSTRAVQEDILFNLNLPHTTTGTGNTNQNPTPSMLSSTSITASLFSDVVPLDQLKLLLKLDAPPTSTATQSGSEGGNDQAIAEKLLETYLLLEKSKNDTELNQALQLENLSLRSKMKDEEKRSKELEEEVTILKRKVVGMEEAISNLLDPSSAPAPTPS